MYNFFEYMVGVLLIAAAYVGYKLIFKTKLRPLAEIDLQTGRRHLSEEEIDALREYYARPAWRRGISYLQIW